jgi:hypothetical protein
MQITKFPSGAETGTVVVSYYPLNGNDANTGPRYQEEAELTGFDILGITRDGSNTTHTDASIQNSFDPKVPAKYEQNLESHVEKVARKISDYDTVILRGQSVGSFPTLALVKNGIYATHLLLEDGVNLRYHKTRESKIYSWYTWVSAQFSEMIAMPKPPHEGWEAPKTDPQPDRVRKLITDIRNSSLLWRSSYSHDAVLDIVRDYPKLPVLCKFLGNSVVSTPALFGLFAPEFDAAAKVRVARAQNSEAAPARQYYDDTGWHGYHLYPQYGAANLIQASHMPSYVANS